MLVAVACTIVPAQRSELVSSLLREPLTVEDLPKGATVEHVLAVPADSEPTSVRMVVRLASKARVRVDYVVFETRSAARCAFTKQALAQGFVLPELPDSRCALNGTCTSLFRNVLILTSREPPDPTVKPMPAPADVHVLADVLEAAAKQAGSTLPEHSSADPKPTPNREPVDPLC